MADTPADTSAPSVVDMHYTALPDMDGADIDGADIDGAGFGEADTGDGDHDSGLGKWSGSVPPPADDDELVGTTLSNTYEVLRILGEGGMGRVYEAQHTRIQSKRFAVKALHPEFARRSDVLARFQREVEAAASIDSPHVVGVYDVDQTEDGRPFLVSELLKGQELGDYLEEHGKTDIAFTVNVVRQICQALVSAHEKGVIHRDMKPENVFLSGDPQTPLAKVLDFGISRLDGQQGNTLTKTGFIMGTPSYMAPEQAKGLRVDHRADIYSVGAILYQMVTGRIPFDRNDATATLAAVLTEDPEPPRSLDSTIPEHFEMIVQRAMAKEPEDRFQSMAELDHALAPYDEPGHVVDEPSRSLRLRPLQGSMVDATAQAREATSARPNLVLFGTTLIGGLGLALLTAIVALLRLSKESATATASGMEALVVAVVLLAAISTPLILLVRHVKKTIWPNTAKVLELLQRLRPPLIATLAIYAVGAILLRALETVVLRTPTGMAWPGWDVLLPFFAIGSGVLVYFGGSPTQAGWLDRLGKAPAVAIAGLVGVVLMASAVGLRGAESGPVTVDAGSDEAPAAETADSEEGADEDGDAAAKPESTVPPMTSREAIAQWDKISHYIKAGRTKEAVAALGPLLELDPHAAGDSDVRAGLVTLTVRACLQNGETCNTMLDTLTKDMGRYGPDVLHEVMVTKGQTSAQRHATRLLMLPEVQEKASRAMLVAYRLRVLPGCEKKKKLFPEALKNGDHRALRELKIMASRNQCRMLKCCLDNDADLKATITAIKERLSR